MIYDFLKMNLNPSEFIGLNLGENPQNFIDEIQKILRLRYVMAIETGDFFPISS